MASHDLSKICLIKINLWQYTIKILKTLAIETYKVQQRLSTILLNEVFVERQQNYNLRIKFFLNRWRENSVKYGAE